MSVYFRRPSTVFKVKPKYKIQTIDAETTGNDENPSANGRFIAGEGEREPILGEGGERQLDEGM